MLWRLVTYYFPITYASSRFVSNNLSESEWTPFSVFQHRLSTSPLRLTYVIQACTCRTTQGGYRRSGLAARTMQSTGLSWRIFIRFVCFKRFHLAFNFCPRVCSSPRACLKTVQERRRICTSVNEYRVRMFSFLLSSCWRRFLVLPHDTTVWNAGEMSFLPNRYLIRLIIYNMLLALQRALVIIKWIFTRFPLSRFILSVARRAADDLQLLCLCVLFVSQSRARGL